MESECYSLIIATNSGAQAIHLRIAKGWVKAVIGLGFIAFLLTVSVAIDFYGLKVKADEHVILVGENNNLKAQVVMIEKQLASALADLTRIHRFTTKLNIITSRTAELFKIEKEVIQNVADASSAEDESGDRSPASLEALPTSIPELNDELPIQAARELVLDPGAPLPERVEGALDQAQLREQELMDTLSVLSDRQSLLSAMPSIKPARGYYSSLFGYRYDPINGRPLLHAGLDIAAPWGTQVLAPADGVVSFAGPEGGYGNLVAIDHGFGITTRFGHNSRIFVHQGQHVHRWDVISAVGSTGHSTGAHVHYEVRIHGLPVNPANYILQEN